VAGKRYQRSTIIAVICDRSVNDNSGLVFIREDTDTLTYYFELRHNVACPKVAGTVPCSAAGPGIGGVRVLCVLGLCLLVCLGCELCELPFSASSNVVSPLQKGLVDYDLSGLTSTRRNYVVSMPTANTEIQINVCRPLVRGIADCSDKTAVCNVNTRGVRVLLACRVAVLLYFA
jgi:hypothetical protein